MTTTTTAESSLFPNLPLIEWGLRHASDLKRVAADFTALTNSADLPAKAAALKDVIDILVVDLADFPGLTSAPPGPMHPPAPIGPVEQSTAPQSAAEQLVAIHGHISAIGDGKIIEAVVSLVTNPQFLQLLTTIIGLFATGKVGTLNTP